MQHYYKEIKNGEIWSYQVWSYPVDIDNLFEISEAEYNSAMEQFQAKAEEKYRLIEEAIIAEQKRIENLEKENASLLFQLLTGEEYTDV